MFTVGGGGGVDKSAISFENTDKIINKEVESA